MFTRTTHRFVPMALVAAVAATFLQTTAFAAVPQEPNGRTVLVTANGLDLATAEGRAALDTRIATAAQSVCRPDDLRDMKALANRAACQRAAIASAQPMKETLVARAEAREQLAAARNPATGIN
jgi:UrcA family protein